MARRRASNVDAITPEQASKHEQLMPLLEAMFREFQDATKKKPDAALNKRKVAIVNRLLADVYLVLDGQTTRAYLDLLDEDDLPQNSDVSLIIGQAVAAMKAFHQKYYTWNGIESTWSIG